MLRSSWNLALLFPGLDSLTVQGNARDDVVIELCRQWPRLRTISLVGSDNNLSERCVRSISSLNKCLSNIDLSGLSRCLHPESLLAFEGFKLRRLDVTQCKKLTSESLLHLLSPGKAESLAVGGLDLDEDFLAALVRLCPRLRQLDLHLCPKIGDKGIQVMASQLTGLQELSLGGCYNVTDAGIGVLVAHCTRLKKLVLRNCDELTDGAIQSVARLGCLSHLNLRGCYLVTENGVAFLLEACSTIAHLDVVACTLLVPDTVARIARAQSRPLRVRGPQCGKQQEYGAERRASD